MIQGRSFWRGAAFRSIFWQAVTIAAVAVAVWGAALHALQNMQDRGIQSGFDFLPQPAGFDISESPIAFDPAMPYWRALAVGLLNTVRVAVLGIVFATLMGTLLGAGRLSRNALVRGLCHAYVEVFRNVPLLLQLLVWYVMLTEGLPDASHAWQWGSLFLSKAGLSVPSLHWGVSGNRGIGLDLPRRGAFAIEGGAALSPEFLALLIGLTVYTAAFIAEIVRAGIQSVPRGQAEAAAVLGLNRRQALRRVLLPQAWRLVIPPLTNQCLSLTKNSSLALAIGYPDVVSIASTSLNQSGRAVECIALVMAVYLALSLATSALTQRFNRKAAIRER